MENNILLIGFMGAGKTTVSRELTKLTGMEEIDMDAVLDNMDRIIQQTEATPVQFVEETAPAPAPKPRPNPNRNRKKKKKKR